ncbi:kinesin-like protein KIN-13A isoform X1 [Iris pallida]|uniref:Kinesin-like protein KIN-13A isoform X1 n=1 Tax=Iris pallida TaxID=29817 RepID=A0AAX6EGV7_IRIPA|nr:kinesin-like protein KIN-13A isoform X1 [Iris pallida]
MIRFISHSEGANLQRHILPLMAWMDRSYKARLSIVQDLIHLQPPVDMGVEHTTMMEERDVDRGLRLMAPRF